MPHRIYGHVSAVFPEGDSADFECYLISVNASADLMSHCGHTMHSQIVVPSLMEVVHCIWQEACLVGSCRRVLASLPQSNEVRSYALSGANLAFLLTHHLKAGLSFLFAGVEHEVHLETVGSNNESVLNDDAPNQKDKAAASGDADLSVPTKASAVPSLAPLPPPPYQQPSIDPAAASVHHIPNPHQPHGHVPPQSYGSLAPHNFPVHSGAPYAAPPLAHPHYHHPAAVTAPPYNDYHYNGHYGHAHNPPAPVPVHHLGPYTHHPPHHHAYPPLPVPAMYQPHQWPASAPHHFHHQPQPHPYGSAGWYPQHPAQYPPGPGC